MTRLRNYLLVLSIISLLISTTSAQQADIAKLPDKSADKLGAELELTASKAAEAGFSGAVLVAKGGKILLNHGYGLANRERNIPVKAGTVVSIGSISKAFTMAAIYKLEQDGKLNVNDPLTRFFDRVPQDKTGITVYHLLKHTSGLGEYHDTQGDFEPMTKNEALQKIFGQKLKFEPGQQESYSNPGYTLLAMIVEKASGKRFQAYLKDELFDPAGMTAMGFYGNRRWQDEQVARGYNARKVVNENSPLKWAEPTWALLGNGGLASTAEDLYKWTLAVKGTQIFSEETKRKYFPSRPVIVRAGHNDFGFFSLYYDYPNDDATVIILSNSSNPGERVTELLEKIGRQITTVPDPTGGLRALRPDVAIVRTGPGGNAAPPPGAVIVRREGPEQSSGGTVIRRGPPEQKADASAKITTEVKADAPAKIEQYLTRLAPFGFSGSVLVAKDDRILFHKAYGMADRAKGVANTTDTLFDTGSVAKQFTAAAIFKLEMMGKLKSGDAISKHLDNVPADKQAITIFQLLAHTSGVVTSQNIYAGDNFSDRDKRVKQILDAPLLFKPGERYDYSNAGYNLAAAIIEKVSGQSYQQFLYENLFKPAGMTSTMFQTGRFAIPGADQKTVARLYAGARDNGLPRGNENFAWFLIGPGGILTTTGDFLKWHQALNGDKILSVEAKKRYDELATTVGTMRDSPYGKQVSHGGGTTMGTGATFARFLDANVLIATCLNNSGEEFNQVVTRAIVSALFGRELNMPPAVVSISPAAMAKVAGTYDLPAGGKVTAFVADGQLRLAAEDGKGLAALFETRSSERYQQLEERTRQLVEAGVKGNYEPMRQAMISPLAIDRLTAREQRSWQEWQAKHGSFKGFVIIGTTPEPMDDAAVNVRFDFERGSTFTQYVWFPRGLDGVRLLPGPPTKIFFPASETEFVSYNLLSGATTRINFKLDAAGKATGLELKNRDQVSTVSSSASNSTVIQKSDQKSDTGKFPDTPPGRVAAAYFKAFNSGDEKVMKEFFLNHLSKTSLANRPMEDRIKVYHQLRDDLGALEVDTVSDASAQGITVKAQIKSGGEVEFRFQMDAEEPQKLKALGVERR